MEEKRQDKNYGKIVGTVVSADTNTYGKNKDRTMLRLGVSANGSRLTVLFWAFNNELDRAYRIMDELPIGTKVDISCQLVDNTYENKQGQTIEDVSITGNWYEKLPEFDERPEMAIFAFKGKLLKMNEAKRQITVQVDDSYEKNGRTIENLKETTFTFPEELWEKYEVSFLEPGTLVGVGGNIINRYEVTYNEVDGWNEAMGDIGQGVSERKLERELRVTAFNVRQEDPVSNLEGFYTTSDEDMPF